jgi:hypothetical protein
MMKRRWLVLSVVVLSLVVALPASTQTKSVLANGDFEVDTAGWAAEYGVLARTTTAPHGGVGAAQVTALAAEGGVGWIRSQCIDLTPELATWPVAPDGKKYLTLNGYVKSDGAANVALEIEFYTGNDCTDSIVTKSSVDVTNTDWTLLSATEDITDTASSVTISVWGYTAPEADTVFYADDLTAFSSASVNAVQMQELMVRGGFWGVGVAGMVLASVVLVRRRKTV